MTDPTADGHSSRSSSSLRAIGRAVVRLVGDWLVLTLWVVFLTLLFLEVTWPRWAFYGLLLGGVAVYVSVTGAWVRERPSHDAER